MPEFLTEPITISRGLLYLLTAGSVLGACTAIADGFMRRKERTS